MYRCVTKSCDENIDFNLNSHQDVILHGREKEFPFKPRILLSCGHSICEKCIFTAVTSRQEEFIRCEDCGQTTTFSAQTIQTIRVNRPQVKTTVRWNEGCEDDLLYEAFSIGAAFNSGRISISATPCVDLDEVILESPNLPSHSYRNEPEVLYIHERVSNAPESFKSIVKDGISMYSACGVSLKHLFETKTALNKQFVQTKEAIRKRFHVLHGLLQLEEANLIRELVKSKENTLKSIQGKEKAIDSARNHLKSIILRSPQYAHSKSDNPVRNEIEQYRSKPLRIDLPPELQNHLSSLSKPHDDLQAIKKLADFRKAIRFDVNFSFGPLISSNQPTPNISIPVESPVTRKKSRPKALAYVNYLKSHLVTIHDVKDSGYFAAHLPSDENVAISLAKALLKWCNIYRHPPSLSKVKPSSDVIVWHDQKLLWVRAKLKRLIEEPQPADKENFNLLDSRLTPHKVEVTLVDYAGEVYETSFANLRESCSQLTDQTTYPPLFNVLKCRFKNLHPLSANLRSGVLSFCPSGIKVRLLILSEPIDDVYEVDVAHDIRDLVNPQPTLIEYLIYKKYAKLKDPLQQLPYPSASVVLVYREAQLFVVDEVHSVDITFIRNPSYFYVVDAKKRDEIESIEKKINELYSSQNSISLRLYFPRNWVPCAARCELFWDKKKKRGKMFHRGYIIRHTDNLPPGMCEFFTVDYGESVFVPLSEVRILPDCFVSALPRTAINCSLHDIAPVDSRNWSQNAIAAFTEFFQATDTPTAITVKSRGEKKLNVVVNLHALNANFPGGNINEILIQDGYAIKKSQVTPMVDLSKDDQTPSTSNGHRASGNRMDFNCYNLIQDFVRKSKIHKLNRIDSLIPVIITAFESPESFYIQINTPEVQTDISNYMKRLDEEFADIGTDRVASQMPMQGFDVGEQCIYLYREENSYATCRRRGLIKAFLGRPKKQDQRPNENSVDPRQMRQVSPDSLYKIRDRDYGLTLVVKRADMLIMRPSSPYRKEGEKCLQVHIPGIKRTADEWTENAIDFCNLELRKHHDKFFIQIEDKLTQDQPESLGVDVIYHTIEIPDACLPSEDHYYSLRYQLLESGHALLVREDLHFEKEIKIEDDSVYADIKVPFSIRDDSTLSSLRSTYYTDNQLIDNIKYLEAKRPEVDEFNAICTHVDDGPCIWFRLWEESPNEPSIGTINRKIMKRIMTQERLIPFKGNAEMGRACTVYNDSRWHRAEIQSTVGNKITVHHVDTGESKAYFIDKISGEVFCDGIPKLALEGRLDRCAPFVERRSDAPILLKKYLEEHLVGKKIRVKWENVGSTRKMAISVSLGDKGRDLKSILLNLDLVRESSSVSEDLPQYIRASLELMMKSEFSFMNHQFVMDKFYYITIGHFVKENYLYVQLNPFKKLSCPEEYEINELYEKYDFDAQTIHGNVSSFSKALDFNVGNSCCALYENEWFRGIVSSVIIPKRRFEVFFVDWGNTEINDIENMRILPDSLGISGNPIFGFYVRLSNLRPRRRVWNQRLYDMMKQMIDEKANSVEFMIKFKSNTIPFDVELWTVGTDNQPDSLFFSELIDGGFLETV